jgi:NADPH:quinone reductase-like Zn-dependent oxidoreductase
MLSGRARAHHGQILRQVAALVDAGKLQPLVDEGRFTLATAGDAHAWLASRQARGKIVVDIG